MNSRVISSIDREQWVQARRYAQEACQSFQFSVRYFLNAMVYPFNAPIALKFQRKSKEEVRILIHLSSLVSNIFDHLDPDSVC